MKHIPHRKCRIDSVTRLVCIQKLACVPGTCEREHNGSLIEYRYELKRKADILRNYIVE